MCLGHIGFFSAWEYQVHLMEMLKFICVEILLCSIVDETIIKSLTLLQALILSGPTGDWCGVYAIATSCPKLEMRTH